MGAEERETEFPARLSGARMVPLATRGSVGLQPLP
jgi:hypothetical protein